MLDPNFAETECCKCGIRFAVPQRWQENRIRDGRRFWCPNGHGQGYVKDEKPTIEQRQELVLALHRAEQAEAKAAELARTALPGTSGEPTAEAAADGPVLVTFDGHWLHCPRCDKPYKGRHCLKRHLRDVHGLELDTVNGIKIVRDEARR